jgi:predicted transcriptional regulator
VLLAYKHYVVFRRRNKPKTGQHISFIVIFATRKHLFYASSFSFVIDNRYRINLKSVSNLENGKRRRDRLYIIAQILEISKSGCLKTQIMYRANLSFAQLNEYLSFLTKVNLLKPKIEDNKTLYVTSSKGNQYLEKYEDIADLLEENRHQ